MSAFSRGFPESVTLPLTGASSGPDLRQPLISNPNSRSQKHNCQFFGSEFAKLNIGDRDNL
jgi:hypothetical protein